jgi:hypothetical protein
MNLFYVYEHWRPDKAVCFYVGKGKGARAHCLNRRENKRHVAIVKKLRKMKLEVEIRIISSGLSEAAAFVLEVERIAFHRASNQRELVNLTDGGDGAAGRRMSTESIQKLKTRFFTQEHRRRISEAKKGKAQSPEHAASAALARSKSKKSPSPETRKAMSDALRGKPRSDEVKAKISAALKGKSNVSAIGREPWCKGKHLSDETRRKMSESRRGKKRGPMSLVQRKKIGQSLRGRSNVSLKGKPLSTEHRMKLVEAWQRRRARDEQTSAGAS